MNVEMNPDNFRKLRRLNLFLGLFTLIPGLFAVLANNAIVALSDFKFQILSNKLDELAQPIVIAEVPFMLLMGITFLISVVFHFVIFSPQFNSKYNNDLQKGMNKFKWVEYLINNTLLTVMVALLFGINTLSTLLFIVGLSAVFSFLGLILEQQNKDAKDLRWSGLILQSAVAVFIYAGIYLSVTLGEGIEPIASHYLAIFGVMALYTVLTFANKIMQNKKIKKYKDYLYGERVHIYLMLIAKVAIMLIGFFGTLSVSTAV